MDENPNPARSLLPWALCLAVLLAPGLLVWAVRLFALIAACAPGPGLCRGLALGAGLRDALMLAWLVATNAFLLIALSLAAALFAFRVCRPMTGTLSLLILPVASPLLPILAVLSARYDGCVISSDGVGNCLLWGATMGMSFHNAAIAHDVLFSVLPFSFALTVMLGVLGFVFARPKPTGGHASASLHDPFDRGE